MKSRKTKITHWQTAIFRGLIVLIILFLYPFTWFVDPGENIFNVKFWFNFISTHPKVLLVIIGYPIAFWTIGPEIYFLLGLPFFYVFDEKGIILYSLTGIKKINWSEVSSFEVNQLENSPGRKSKSFKIYEIRISKNHDDKEIKLILKTFSNTKIDSILNMRNSADIHSPD